MRALLLPVLMFVAIVVALPQTATAAPITFRFVGTVTGGEAILEIGDRFHGTFTFDGAALDTRPDDPTIGLYLSPEAAPFGYRIRSGDFRVERRTGLQVMVLDDGTFGCGPNPCDLIQWADFDDDQWFAITLVTFTHLDLVTSDALSTRPPPLLFNPHFTFLRAGVSPSQDVFGTIDSITVPEPSTLALFGIAAAGMIWKRSLGSYPVPSDRPAQDRRREKETERHGPDC